MFLNNLHFHILCICAKEVLSKFQFLFKAKAGPKSCLTLNYLITCCIFIKKVGILSSQF